MNIIYKIETVLKTKVLNTVSVTGGDINEAFKIETDKGFYFLKTNDSPHALSMFKAEVEGLAEIGQTEVIRVPKVIACEEDSGTGFLILEFIEPQNPTRESWEKLGQQLASLHQHTAEQFGFEFDNFIGTLPQSNQPQDSWLTFYKEERIRPQLDLAYRRNRLSNATFAQFEDLFVMAESIFPEEPASLIHGDLWKGNFLFDQNGAPVLIDPAVAYGHREMDIAMTKLFGGFDDRFYAAYEEAYPLEPGFVDRMELYQLYYLLVHVNLFGGNYIASVERILSKFV